MGLDIWFKDDIANILRAANEANLAAMVAAAGADPAGPTGETSRLRQAYRDGFAAALATVALALGLPAPAIRVDAHPPDAWVREVIRVESSKRISPPRR